MTLLALITGGGTGIGRAVGERLSSEGWRVIAAGLQADADLPEPIEFIEADVSDIPALQQKLPSFDRLDGLVLCAGILRHDLEWEAETFAEVLSINVTAGFALANAMLPYLVAAKGGVVTMASMWSIFGSPGAPAYTASKGAVSAMTRSMAVAWAPQGVRVNAVAPGWVETAMSKRAWDDESRRDRINARIPIGRWASPADVASVIRFLLSPDASYVTGTVLPVDGGYSVA